MIKEKTVTAIILCAGNSTRYGQNRNKNFEKIKGKTVLSYSINVFYKNKYIDNIIIVAKENEIEIVKNSIPKELSNKNIRIIVGGDTRKESVYNGLTATNSDIVIIHDGARPVIKTKYIDKCVESMDEFKGVTIGVKSKDTIKITDSKHVVVETTKRENTWIVQTPQCFNRKILLDMHEKYKNSEVTDDCMLLEKDGYKIKIIEGDYTNIKITTYEDINIVKQFLL